MQGALDHFPDRPLSQPLLQVGSAAAREAAEERRWLVHRAKSLAWSGIAWHAAEFAVAIAAGVAASSVALIAFGIDSLIESFAGFVLIWRFGDARTHLDTAERRAQQLIAISFYALAVYVAVEAVRSVAVGDHADPSPVGLGLAAVTAVAMPVLARAKRRVGERLGSSATVKEGAQNQLCAYLSLALLVGLGANALLGLWWMDSAAALAIAVV